MTNVMPQNELPWRDLGLLCLIAIIADLHFAGLTSMVVAYQHALHFDLKLAGWTATAEGAGYALGMLQVALFGTLRPTRARVGAALAVLALAQFLSALPTGASLFCASRAISGLAAGFVLAFGTAVISAARNPGRAFALYFGTLFVSGMIALPALSRLLISVGFSDTYLVYGVLILLTMVLLPWYPDQCAAAGDTGQISNQAGGSAAPRRLALLIASIFVNFVFNGGLWVMAEEFGLRIPGTHTLTLSGLLGGTMAFGILGTGTAALLPQQRHQLGSILAGNATLVAAVIVMTIWHTVATLVFAMSLLNFSVTFLTPAALAAASIEHKQGAQWGNLACQLGYSAGPATVAALDASFGARAVAAASVCGFLMSAALAWLAIADGRSREFHAEDRPAVQA